MSHILCTASCTIAASIVSLQSNSSSNSMLQMTFAVTCVREAFLVLATNTSMLLCMFAAFQGLMVCKVQLTVLSHCCD